MYVKKSKRVRRAVLARWLSWLEHHLINQNVMGSIPSQGTYLGCRFDSWLGLINVLIFSFSVSLSFTHTLFLSIKSRNISSGKD